MDHVAALTAAGVIDLRAGRPGGPAWATVPELLDDLVPWHERATAVKGDRRAMASFLATWTAGAPALVMGLSHLVGRVLPDVRDVAAVAVRRDDAGEVDAYRLAPDVASIDDPSDAEVAARIAGIVDPLVERVCGVLPMGRRVVWGSIADALAGYAVYAARSMHGDAVDTWGRVNGLLDALSEHVPLRRRPRLFPVRTATASTHFTVRATCCLHYRIARDAAEPGYCSSCPLRDDVSRSARLRAHLESLARASA